MTNSSKSTDCDVLANREARHITLARDINEQVKNGLLKPGDRLPSFNEMRARHGIGRDTLERMHDLLEREGLIVRRQRSGVYVADPGAPKRLGMIGFVTHLRLLRHPYYTLILDGVMEEAQRAGIEVVLLHSESKIAWENIDGIIYPCTMRGQLNKPYQIPQVSLIHAQPHIDSIIADDYVGQQQAVEHLWDLGHRRIAFLTSEVNEEVMSHRRLDAYSDTLRSKGVEPSKEWMRGVGHPKEARGSHDDFSYEELGYRAMQRWLEDDWEDIGCTAILTQNDDSAVGVIRAFEEGGRKVPRDVSVVGFDGTGIARFHRPTLTTVKVPLSEIGARAFRMLMEAISQPLWPQNPNQLAIRVLVPTALQIGQSTGPVPHPVQSGR